MALSGKQKVGVYLTGLLLGMVVVSVMPRNEESSPRDHWHEQTAAEGYYPLAFEDAYGRNVELVRQPRHFISLAPSVTETLYAMGMGDHLMAVTRWCNYPAEARLLKNTGGQIGSMDKPDLEAILNYHADLVIGSKLTPAEIYSLIETQSKTVTVALAWDRLKAIKESMKSIGVLTGVPKLALEMMTQFEANWEAAQAKLTPLSDAPKPKAVYLMGLASEMQPGWTAGSSSWVGDLLIEAGFENGAEAIGNSWGELSLENLLKINPEVLFIRGSETEGATAAIRERIEKLSEHPVWKNVDAVKNKQVYVLSYAPFTIPGPRVLKAYEELVEARLLVSQRQD